MTRRTALRAVGAAAGTLAVTGLRQPLLPSVREARAEVELPWTPIGFSQGGQPLVLRHLGDAQNRVLILGGQHGAPEANTIELVNELTTYLVEHSDAIPKSLGLDILAITNPDGATAGSRQYLSGVDPNRNWGGPDWASDAYDSNGRFRPGLGGPEPFSEQETRALADWMLANRPLLTVNYHSAGGFLFGTRDGKGGELTSAYVEASGYYAPTPGGGGSPLPYRATGSLNVWARTVGLNTLFIELSTPTAIEFERNLAGLLAVLPLLA
ncbi:MAG: M14 family zinc carboxypeptidase [Chloroflexota bacterium]